MSDANFMLEMRKVLSFVDVNQPLLVLGDCNIDIYDEKQRISE